MKKKLKMKKVAANQLAQSLGGNAPAGCCVTCDGWEVCGISVVMSCGRCSTL